MHIGNVTKGIREGKGLQQEDVSQRSGLKPDYISKIERGKVQHPNIKTLHKLAQGLKTRLYKIVKIWEENQ
jgi:transcriptional regulator with XRE-family HTH domain